MLAGERPLGQLRQPRSAAARAPADDRVGDRVELPPARRARAARAAAPGGLPRDASARARRACWRAPTSDAARCRRHPGEPRRVLDGRRRASGATAVAAAAARADPRVRLDRLEDEGESSARERGARGGSSCDLAVRTAPGLFGPTSRSASSAWRPITTTCAPRWTGTSTGARGERRCGSSARCGGCGSRTGTSRRAAPGAARARDRRRADARARARAARRVAPVVVARGLRGVRPVQHRSDGVRRRDRRRLGAGLGADGVRSGRDVPATRARRWRGSRTAGGASKRSVVAWEAGYALQVIGGARWFGGDERAAGEAYDEAVAIFERLGHRSGARVGAARRRPDGGALRQTRARQRDVPAGAAPQHAIGDRAGSAQALNFLAAISRDNGDHETALGAIREALSLAREVGELWATCWALDGLAGIARDVGEPEIAARLLAHSGGSRRAPATASRRTSAAARGGSRGAADGAR